jgi:fatty acid desaturase
MAEAPIAHESLRIPNRLNIFILFSTSAILVALMWLGSRLWGSPGAMAGCLLAFSLDFLCFYSLLHEAAHDKLHSDPRWNYLLGAFGCMIFPMPFSMFRVTHWNHHLRNRTDTEMYDMYYPEDGSFARNLSWYSALFGAWYWIIPPAVVLFAFGPASFKKRIARHHRKLGDLRFEDLELMNLRRVKLETAASIAYFALLCWAFGWRTVLLFHGVGTIWWSTTQYIEHFRTPRDVLHGAWNLRASRWYSLLNLHRELDFNHHRYTEVPWIHLPRIPAQGHVGPRYLGHWFLQWTGPLEARAPGPEAVNEIRSDYSRLELLTD